MYVQVTQIYLKSHTELLYFNELTDYSELEERLTCILLYLAHYLGLVALFNTCGISMYLQVLSTFLRHLPAAPAVREVVTDFEMSLWNAVHWVLPTAKRLGCAFHFNQALWQKI